MAQKVIVRTTCDIHPDEEATHIEVPLISPDGVPMKMDLCDSEFTKLELALEPFLENATRERASGNSGRASRRASSRPSAGSKHGSAGVKHDDPIAVREWAKNHGHKVSERGRIPTAVLEAYHAAH